MKFKKILLTTDFSEASTAGFSYLQHCHEDAHIQLLHVIPLVDSYMFAGGEFSSPLVLESHIKESKEIAEKKIKELAKQYLSDKKVDTFVLNAQSNVTDSIISFAKENHVDLIIVSTQGHGALGSLLLGSITQKLLTLSKCPVLVVPYRPQV